MFIVNIHHSINWFSVPFFQGELGNTCSWSGLFYCHGMFFFWGGGGTDMPAFVSFRKVCAIIFFLPLYQGGHQVWQYDFNSRPVVGPAGCACCHPLQKWGSGTGKLDCYFKHHHHFIALRMEMQSKDMTAVCKNLMLIILPGDWGSLSQQVWPLANQWRSFGLCLSGCPFSTSGMMGLYRGLSMPRC